MADLHQQGFLRIAVASDLHAFPASATAQPSHLRVLAAADIAEDDPVRHLKQLITQEQLQADLLLSPGDLGDKASPDGIAYAWKCLHELGGQLGAHLITAASGNHDLDSRHGGYSADPSEVLQRLDPPYPLPDDTDNDKYWARKFVIRTTPEYRLVVLNSAAYHGGKPDEIEYGRISQFTLSRLERELQHTTRIPPVNIVLCHHHPHQFPEIFETDDTYDVMKNGQQLLDLLGKGENGEWIVIHGHKHHARVAYAQGGNSSPVVIAAGSFSAVIHPKLQTEARNQFYILELPLNSPIGMVGTIRAWDWTRRGWIPARDEGSGLPSVSRFGCRDSIQNLARRINERLGNSTAINWQSILDGIPELEFLLPTNMQALINVLSRQYSISVERENGALKELGRTRHD
jgi:hypothetical protein